MEAQHKLSQGSLEPPEDGTPEDRRFANALWQTHPYFNFIKQQYLLNSEAVEHAVQDLEGLDAKEKKRIENREIVG